MFRNNEVQRHDMNRFNDLNETISEVKFLGVKKQTKLKVTIFEFLY